MNPVLLTHKGIIAGKLNGVIPAVTPSGKRKVKVSMSFEMFCSASPRWRDGMLQQCSTTSEISYQSQNQKAHQCQQPGDKSSSTHCPFIEFRRFINEAKISWMKKLTKPTHDIALCIFKCLSLLKCNTCGNLLLELQEQELQSNRDNRRILWYQI